MLEIHLKSKKSYWIKKKNSSKVPPLYSMMQKFGFANESLKRRSHGSPLVLLKEIFKRGLHEVYTIKIT